jgi:hypothetical protein
MKTTESVAIAVSAVAALVGIIAVAYSDDGADDNDSAGEKQGVKKQSVKELEARLDKRVTEMSATVSAVDASLKAARVLSDQSVKNLEEIKDWVGKITEGEPITDALVREGEGLLDSGDKAAAEMRVRLENLDTELLEKLTLQADKVCKDASHIREVLRKLAARTMIEMHSDGLMIKNGPNSVKYSPHGLNAAWQACNDTNNTCSLIRPPAAEGDGT